jgi:hypothetical protein
MGSDIGSSLQGYFYMAMFVMFIGSGVWALVKKLRRKP